ncbi:MAG: DNA-binding protein [Thermoplasmata archaeon HGW-Thermoplasmata-1]|nr:MAG: DNA-binding protein [Thermoplasmata archaeon HGW-Thermoplasmata-1]
MWIAVDDTDSTSGMCTTYLVSELISEFSEYDVICYPRLIRLNPDVPWKTRGNAALAVRFGKGRGEPVACAMVNGKTRYCYAEGDDARGDESTLERAARIVESMSVLEDEKTNPGLAVFNSPPPDGYYWKAVREILTVEDAKRELDGCGALYRSFKNGRGLIGATGAAAWDETGDRTFEIIAYRQKTRWGTKRIVDDGCARDLDRICPSSFDNYDPRNGHNRITPNSPCPILYGIRGDDPKELAAGMQSMKSEPVDRWTLFISNQGTDDHLVEKDISEIRPGDSVIVRGTVAAVPKTIEGSHVFFELSDGDAVVDCAAYEPTKEFRDLIRKLRPGDVVSCYGCVREMPRTINLEKIRIESLVSVREKTANPRCEKCGRSMKSVGAGLGYRCRSCGEKADISQAAFCVVDRDIAPGFYEVPVCARRHLAMPLKRLGKI